MFIKLDGITGESKDGEHEGEIDVLAWSWGMSQSGTAHMGGGGGSGKVSVQDLSFTKYVDKSSTDLLLFCANGKHLTEGTLTLRKAGETPLTYLKIKLTDVLISSFATGGAGSQDRLTENVGLNFAKVEVEYTPQKEDGSGDAPTNMGWDISKNQKI